MSQSQPALLRSDTADAAVVEYTFAKITSTGLDTAATATSKIVGVFQRTAASGEEATIACGGTTKIKLVGTVSRGDKLTASTAGKAIATVTDKDVVGGVALEDGVTGDIIEMQIENYTLSI